MQTRLQQRKRGAVLKADWALPFGFQLELDALQIQW
jgi:hypothetical protein